MAAATIVIAVGTLVSAAAIVLQWREMVGGGTQTDQIITAAKGIEGDQNQLIADNKQTLADNRQALKKTLEENRAEVAKILKQNRDALQAQTKASSAQLEVMRDADRPWINVDILIKSPLTYDGDAAAVGFTFVVANIGRSPAQNVSVTPTLTPAFLGDDLKEIETRVCDAAAAPIGMGYFRYVLFPGHPFTQEPWMNISVKDLDSHWGKMPQVAKPPDSLPIALVGCVDYTYESSARHHQTAFAVDLLMKDRRLPLKSMTPIQPSDLILVSHPVSSHYPN
jgi:ElaB/YqjD/DUF883 family membrane-anchored ribosome-binding protein